ncbi:PfkB family carbohydrate kinase [Aestuariivita boseongensis]|uniref:PfkB family carbohydrate kinase n=1 Tax=Aestuariivita boseongensis TaxID=1470562 RepID=UPI00068340A0|nr:PfkB family carbohydrate kinase [Aestuariivita boseongensis]
MTEAPRLVAAGEAVIDMIPQGDSFRAVPGGAALNAACAAARLGLSTGFFGALSNDALGTRLAQTAVQAGVDLRHTRRVDQPCPVSIIELTEGNARYAIHHQGTAHDTITDRVLPDLSGTRAALLGGFSLIHDPAAQAFEALAIELPSDTALYLDLNIRPGLITDPAAYRARLSRLMARAQVVKASDEDLSWWGDDLRTAAPHALILHTQGAGGATAHRGDVTRHVPAPAAEVTDTVGAGDIFNAGFLAFALEQGHPLLGSPDDIAAALHYAVTAASLSTEKAGAQGPTREEIACAL